MHQIDGTHGHSVFQPHCYDQKATFSPALATWQQPFHYGVMSDGSCVNCFTLDQTY